MPDVNLSLNGVSIWEYKDYGNSLMRITVQRPDTQMRQQIDLSPEQWRTLKNLMDVIEKEPKIG